MDLGRYQLLLWKRWVWHPYRRVTDAPLGYIYSHLGMYGPLEIRRFTTLSIVEAKEAVEKAGGEG